MAKVTLPLLGVAAHGLLANQLMYRERAGMTTAGVWKGKRDAQSEAQLDQRRLFWCAKEIWPFIAEESKAEFAAAAAADHLTSWNYFVGQVLDGVIGPMVIGESIVGGWGTIGWPTCPW